MDSEALNFYYRIAKRRSNMCLFGRLECRDAAVKAHSVQNAFTFDLLSDDGHLITVRNSTDQNHKPIAKWDKIGRNLASTFTGLCEFHDNNIFKPIDLNQFDTSNPKHLFLIAYRSVYKELHENIASGIQTQSAYLRLVNLNKVPGDGSSPQGKLAFAYLMNSHLTQLYKEQYDNAYGESNWDLLAHHILRLEHQVPAIACSQLFSVDFIRHKDDILRIVLNVFPVSEDETLAIFSYTTSEEVLAMNYIESKIYGQRDLLKYTLSKVIIENTSNFFIKPSIFDNWDDEKKLYILKYFEETISQFKDDNSPDLYLFN